MHWDFMLESGGILRTWALAEEPAADRAIAAEALADHRLEYLEFEGPVSGGRGVVARWDRGACEVVCASPNGLELNLAGERLTGRARLSRGGTGWVFLVTGAA